MKTSLSPGLKWDFNRQIDDRIAEVPDLELMGGGIVACDVTRNFFNRLPTMRRKQLLAV